MNFRENGLLALPLGSYFGTPKCIATRITDVMSQRKEIAPLPGNEIYYHSVLPRAIAAEANLSGKIAALRAHRSRLLKELLGLSNLDPGRSALQRKIGEYDHRITEMENWLRLRQESGILQHNL